MEKPTKNEATKKKPGPNRWVPLGLLAALVAIIYFSGITDYLSFEALRDHLGSLQAFVSDHVLIALFALIGFYALGTAVSLPAMSVVTIAAGVIFDLWLGLIGVLAGATLGATIIFLIVKTSFGDSLRVKVRPWLGRFEAGFQDAEFNYLLALRLVPIVPFWVLNIAPALLGMRLSNYMAATALGIIPGSFVYVWVGKGAAETIRLGGRVDAAELLFQPHIIGPMVGLALLSLLPVIVRRIRGQNKAERQANR